MTPLPSTFRWLPGMLTLDGYRIHLRCDRMAGFMEHDQVFYWNWLGDIRDPRPDLTDPATKGCLLELVREASGDPEVSVRHATDLHGVAYWGVWSGDGETLIASGPSEGEALMAALVALRGEK